MLWLPVVGLIVGFITIYWLPVPVPPKYASYLSLATLAGLDSIFGGIRAGIERKFHDDIFISGFAVNTCLAVGLAILGDQIGVDLFLAAVFGYREEFLDTLRHNIRIKNYFSFAVSCCTAYRLD